MNKMLFILLTLVFSSQLYAQCPDYALHGNWKVFYKDNSSPDSVLEPDKYVKIRHSMDLDEYSVNLTDSKWISKRGSWTSSCIGKKVVLEGTIQKRNGSDSHTMVISRVTEASDLLARKNGVKKLDQIAIQIKNARSLDCDEEDADSDDGKLHDPGHSHADR